MDVLVAGGTGFLGCSVCRVLVDRGHRVTAASRSPDDVVLPDAVVRAAMDVTDESTGRLGCYIRCQIFEMLVPRIRCKSIITT